MKQYLVLKLIGLSLLTMITLVIISFIEVAVYSYVINPGQAMGVYDAHAELTAPYVSGIFGFIVFFLVTRYWTKKGYQDLLKLAILFPLTYVLLDLVVILSVAADEWSSFILVIVLANGAKFLGSYLGYRLTRQTT